MVWTCSKNDSDNTVNKNIKISRRQDAPKFISLNVYVTRPNYILNASGLWEGNTIGVEIPENRAIDIDTKYDFEIAIIYTKTEGSLLILLIIIAIIWTFS